jgi:peptide/nickel transport system substrate-binding protein
MLPAPAAFSCRGRPSRRRHSSVTWHDGKPFTAADVKCTWDLLAGTAQDNFKVNFRKGWYAKVESVTVNGDHEAEFNLKPPQPALLASGFTPVYPCHVPPTEMRQVPPTRRPRCV